MSSEAEIDLSGITKRQGVYENLLQTSGRYDREDLSQYRVSRSEWRKSFLRFKKDKRLLQKNNNEHMVNNNFINQSIDGEINFGSILQKVVNQVSTHENEQSEYNLKINKLTRATNQINPKYESQAQQQASTLIFTPQQKFIILMNLATIVVIYIYFTEIPISIAFCNIYSIKSRKSQGLCLNFPYFLLYQYACLVYFDPQYFINLFVLGAIIKTRTAYFQYGILITSTKLILLNYFKSYFLIDLFSIGSIIVYEFSQIFQQGSIDYRFIILLFYLKIGDLMAMQKCMITLYDMNRRVKATLKLFLLLTKIFMLCNIVACGFFYISDNLCKSGGILDNCYECCWTKVVKFDQIPISASDWNTQYSYSIYWASTTMISIGYGDITPQNKFEISYTIVIQYISCLVYAYCLNQIWGIIQQLNSKKQQIQHRLYAMNTYMRDKNIGPQLRSKIKAYLLHFYHSKNVREKQLQKDIISELTPSLKTQLFYEAYGFIFKGNSYFQKQQFFNDSFSFYILEAISQKIIETGYFEQETIYCPFEEEGENKLFYIQQGQVQNYIQLRKNKITIRKVYLDEMMGLKEFITQLNYTSSLTAIKYTNVYIIKHEGWKQCIMEEDEDYETYYLIKEKILFEKAYQKIDLMCEFCRQNDHATEDCFQTQIDNQTQDFLNRYKAKSSRVTSFQRQNIQSSHINSNVSRIKNNISAFQLSLIKNNQLNQSTIQQPSFRSPRKSSIDVNQFQKRDDIFDRQQNRFKKITHKNPKIHQDIVNQLKTKIQDEGQDLDELYSQDSEMLSGQNVIDKVELFEWYFPKYNADEQIRNWKPKKRMRLLKML